MRNYGLLLGVVALLGITGCWGGTNTVRISSIPSGASLYVNGEHAGETPKSVPSKWWCNIIGVRWGDALRIVLSKDGYQTFERTIPHSELDHRYWSGDCAHGSEFGWGATFGYTFHLVAKD